MPSRQTDQKIQQKIIEEIGRLERAQQAALLDFIHPVKAETKPEEAAKKRIVIDPNKCTGCHCCEIACSLQHVEGTVNPQRSRIRVFREGDLFFPVIAGPYTEAMCNSRHMVIIDGREHDACIFCRASCPAKPIFKEPDIGIPLKCDFCGEQPDPQCVKVCPSGALTLEEEE
jgi:benzoyl-CoA reductase subunit BamC